MDFMGQIRREQAELADQVGARLQKALEPSFTSTLTELIARAEATGILLEEEQVRDQWRADLQHDTFVAIVGYTDWLATRLHRMFQATGAAKTDDVELPTCEGSSRAAIAAKYGVEVAFVGLVVNELVASEGRLPCIGRLHGRHLYINTTQLNQWAAHYDW
jgi:hypothetical protein